MGHPTKQFPDSNFGEKRLKKSKTTKFAAILSHEIYKVCGNSQSNTPALPHTAPDHVQRAFSAGVSPTTPEPQSLWL